MNRRTFIGGSIAAGVAAGLPCAPCDCDDTSKSTTKIPMSLVGDGDWSPGPVVAYDIPPLFGVKESKAYLPAEYGDCVEFCWLDSEGWHSMFVEGKPWKPSYIEDKPA